MKKKTIIKKIKKLRKFTNFSIKKCIKIVEKKLDFKKLLKVKKETIKDKKNYILFLKKNKKKNIIVITKFIFESDLFIFKSKIIKICKKIRNNIYFFLKRKKNNNMKNNMKKKNKKLINKCFILTNEKLNILTKCIYSKKNKIYNYIHLGKKLSIIKNEKINKKNKKRTKEKIKDLLLHILFKKPKNFKIFINQRFIKDEKTKIKKILYDTNIKKYYYIK